ncbi:hypothetical protein D039_3893 [Vibrio parahaemolyticus EKP-028]|nr:hypothetical protein D039_3893 [Vibrio parahaemolyticus EKP-028]
MAFFKRHNFYFWLVFWCARHALNHFSSGSESKCGTATCLGILYILSNVL